MVAGVIHTATVAVFRLVWNPLDLVCVWGVFAAGIRLLVVFWVSALGEVGLVTRAVTRCYFLGGVGRWLGRDVGRSVSNAVVYYSTAVCV